MKTPKRYPETMSVYATRDELLQDRARWKRKNRVAQLKRTIARLKRELALFLEDGRYELIIDAIETLSEHGDAEVKRACLTALADFAK